MSLINDALKRAKQHQPPPEPPADEGDDGAPMRPVEPRQPSASRFSPLIGGLIVVIVLMAGVMFYLAGQSSARTLSPTVAEVGLPPTTTPPVAEPPASTLSVPSTTPLTTNVDPPDPTPPTPPEILITAAPPTIVTQVLVITTNVPAPEPPAMRLQGIYYRPSSPSAVINGKTVFVGDRAGEARVLDITATAVTVLQGGKTNVMTLD